MNSIEMINYIQNNVGEKAYHKVDTDIFYYARKVKGMKTSSEILYFDGEKEDILYTMMSFHDISNAEWITEGQKKKAEDTMLTFDEAINYLNLCEKRYHMYNDGWIESDDHFYLEEGSELSRYSHAGLIEHISLKKMRKMLPDGWKAFKSCDYILNFNEAMEEIVLDGELKAIRISIAAPSVIRELRYDKFEDAFLDDKQKRLYFGSDNYPENISGKWMVVSINENETKKEDDKYFISPGLFNNYYEKKLELNDFHKTLGVEVTKSIAIDFMMTNEGNWMTIKEGNNFRKVKFSNLDFYYEGHISNFHFIIEGKKLRFFIPMDKFNKYKLQLGEKNDN